MANDLSPELVSLIHHVELNKSGWWQKGLQRFILAAVWMRGAAIDRNTILADLNAKFSLAPDRVEVEVQLQQLAKDDALIPFPDGTYKLSEKATKQFEETIKEGEKIERNATDRFVAIFGGHCPTVDGLDAWISISN